MKIQPAESLKTTHWSGGTTTELFIYPPTSSYADRNFDFRFSTATVEVEESNFTHLPGVYRHLMILEGTLELSHNQQPFFQLQPFQQDQFPGDFHSKSKGKVTDLNLMLRGSYSGELSKIELQTGNVHSISKNSHSHLILYIKAGSIQLLEQAAKAGDLVIFSPDDHTDIKFIANTDALILLAVVN